MKKQNMPWSVVEQLLTSKKETRKHFQERLQIEPQVITHWKTRGIPPAYAPKLAEFFNVPAGLFFGEEVAQFESATKLREFKDVPLLNHEKTKEATL